MPSTPLTAAILVRLWRHGTALHYPQAKETKDENQLTRGIVLKNGNDKVLVYQLLQSAGTVIELQKRVGG